MSTQTINKKYLDIYYPNCHYLIIELEDELSKTLALIDRGEYVCDRWDSPLSHIQKKIDNILDMALNPTCPTNDVGRVLKLMEWVWSFFANNALVKKYLALRAKCGRIGERGWAHLLR